MTGYQNDGCLTAGRLDPLEADRLRHQVADLEHSTFRSMIDTALQARRFVNISLGLALAASSAIVVARGMTPWPEAVLRIAAVFSLAAAVLIGGSALLTRRRRLLFEALDAALLRLLACEPSTPALRAFGRLRPPQSGGKESANPSSSHDQSRQSWEEGNVNRGGGWLLEGLEGVAQTSSLYQRGALEHEYQLRRVTAGVEGLIELVPEQLRRTSVPELDEALVGVRQNLISLDNTARHLSEMADAFQTLDPSALQDSVQQAVSATLLGPPEIDFDGWEILEVLGPDCRAPVGRDHFGGFAPPGMDHPCAS